MCRLNYIIVAVCCILCVFVLSNPGSAADAIKVGGMFALSGPYAHVGIGQKNTGVFVCDQVNAAGGINGRMLNFIQADTEGNPTKALLTAKRLVEEEKVAVIIGPVMTDEGMAIKPYLDSAKVPAVMHCASDVIVDLPPAHWVFKTPPRSSHIIQRLFTYMKDHGFKNLGFMYAQTGFGKDALRLVQKFAPEYNINIVGIESFGDKDLDMKPQLLNLMSKNPQAILTWTLGPSSATEAKNFKELGFKIPHFHGHGSAMPEFIKMAGSAAEGIMIAAQKVYVVDELPDSDPQKAINLKFIREFKKVYSVTPGAMEVCGADAASLAVNAMRKAGEDRSAIRDALENTKGFVGLNGTYNMSPQDHNGLSYKDFVLMKVQGGRFRLVKD
jgi:branched-chain amino acid transport system substrate-binding protein